MSKVERKEGYYWVQTKTGWLIMDWQDNSFLLDGHKYPEKFPGAEVTEINETRIPSPDEVPEKALDLHALLCKTVQIYDSNKQKWRFEVLTSRGVISYFCRLPEYAGIKPKTDA